MYTIYSKMQNWNGCNLCRFLSTAEVSTALRPFYFTVHPDLFGKYPEQRKVNENSLKQLSVLLEAQQSSHRINMPPLPFYCRKRELPDGQFKLVNIQLSGNDIRNTVTKILNACEISTEYIDKIPKPLPKKSSSLDSVRRAYEQYDNPFKEAEEQKSKMKEAKVVDSLFDWVQENGEIAKQKYESTTATRQQVDTLVENLRNEYGIENIKWESGYNISHIRGALQSLTALAAHHAKHVRNIKDRTLVFGHFTGVSLDGDVYVSIVEVRSNWLDIFKNVQQQDSALLLIPAYERTLSKILRNIHIKRRKFMPKVSAIEYCNHLRRLTTSIGDFNGKGKNFPSSVPESLDKFEIVIEPEAGPLMLSPTGQFITPSSCPAEELVSFISSHLDEAVVLLTEYSINKHVERSLTKEVQDRLSLRALQKDDSVTPALMITCCQQLLNHADLLTKHLKGNILFITNYYSVVSDGVMCIPWNFK